MRHIALAASVAALTAFSVAHADPMRIVTYNVESDSDTDPAIVAEDIRAINGADLWGLQEVQSNAIDTFRDTTQAPGRDMRFEIGEKGGGDRLAIIYDRNRFEAVDGPDELIDDVGGSRPPLWIKLRDKENGGEFLFVVNHFNRGNAGLRREQAEKLRQWLMQSDMPAIVLGDFNFDVDTAKWREQGVTAGNDAFDAFTAAPASVAWVEHEPQEPTNCSPHMSVLDFVFLAGAARQWTAEADLLFTTQAYCDADEAGGADHRPILATIEPAAAAPPATPAAAAEATSGESRDAAIREGMARIREELNRIESLLQGVD